MSHPQVEALLAAADPLPYPERMKLFAARARALAGNGELEQVLAELQAGDEFAREVGLFLAEVTGQADVVRAYLDQPQWTLQFRALAFLIRTSTLDQATATAWLATASAHARAQLYQGLRANRATDIADALVDQVRTGFGDAEAARLLPICSATTVTRLLPELAHEVNWAAVARRHPQVVLAEAARQLEGLSEPGRVSWWIRHGYGVLAARDSAPTGVLDLLERFAPVTHLPGGLRAYGVLAAADQTRVLALLTAPGRAGWLGRSWLPRALLDRLGRLVPSALTDLARRLRDYEYQLASLLEAVPPSRRGELYDAAYADVTRDQAVVSHELLDVLPRQRRIAEAQRILGLARIRDSERLTLEYTARLDWPDAQPVLWAAVARGEPEERAEAWELLLSCAARSGSPGVVTDVIGRMRRLRNEQDPVRSRALSALAEVQPWLWEPSTAEALKQIAADAMQARDRSPATTRAISELAIAVLRQHFNSAPLLGFAQHALDLVYGSGRLPYLEPLDVRLRHGQEAEFYAAVRGWLEAGIEHGHYRPLFEIVRALGRRAWRLDPLQSLLEQAVLRANVSSTVQHAITDWLADPTQRSARVERVLSFDSSAIALPRVWSVVAGRRTDLLDGVLSGPGPQGRFLSVGVRWLPRYIRYTQRWLPRQRQAYVDLLATLAADAEAEAPARASAIADAARVGGAGLNLVRQYVDSPDITLAEAALGALAWTERPDEALPILLTYMDSDRARVAMYAAGRAARFVAPDRLQELLAPVALRALKVTSRKEALRLLARSQTPGLTDVLYAAWSTRDQHRDIRAAVVSTARQRLDSPAIWQILTEAVQGDRYDVRALSGARPLSIAAAARPRYAELVARACTNPDREAARSAWSVLSNWTQWTSDLTGLLVGQLSDLTDRSLWWLASKTLVSLVSHGSGAGPLAQSIDELLRLDAEDPTRGDPELDRPAYRRLVGLVENLAAWSAAAGPWADRGVLVSAGRQLAAHPDRRHLSGRLLVHAIPLDSDESAGESHVGESHIGESSTVVDALTEVCDLLSANPVAATGVAKVGAELGQRIRALPTAHPGQLLAAARRLVQRADLAGGLLALAVAEHGRALGWPPEWHELVVLLRDHQVADVRLAALDVSVAPDSGDLGRYPSL